MDAIITLEEYKKLIKKAEQIEVISRMLQTDRFITIEDIVAILDIKTPKKES